MNDYKIHTAFLAVFILLVPIVIAAPQGESSITISSGDTGGTIGSTSALKSDGASCSAANECTGGFCNSGVCASSAPSTTTPSSSGTSTTTTPSSDTTTTTPTPEPAPTPIPVTPVKETVTKITTVQEIIRSIRPSDLGVTEIKPENVEVTKTGVAETSTPTQVPIVKNIIEKVLTSATEAQAQQVLSGIKQSVSSGSSAPVSVRATLEVFEVKEKTTGQTSHVSRVSLMIKPDKDLKNVNIVEVIPKSVAASISEVIFLGEQPKVLQADPIVQWEFSEVKKDETKDLSYQVNKKLDVLESNTVAVSEAVIAAPEAPSLIYIYIIIGIAAVAVVVYVLYKRKVGLGNFRFSYKRG